MQFRDSSSRPEIIVNSRLPFSETVETLKVATAAMGMMVQFEIDLQARFLAKGLPSEPTTILGVCSAVHAAKALASDRRVLSQLPCRIAVIQVGDVAEVHTQNTEAMVVPYEGAGLAEVAKEIGGTLAAILASVQE